MKTNCLFFIIRVLFTFLIGLFILIGNLGQEWETGHIYTSTPYKAGLVQQINATIGIKIGLNSVNVTLKSDNKIENFENEIIDYNECFSWTWDQGRIGFGPHSGHLQQEFRQAHYRGVPTPILWVMEYFIVDCEGYRFGKFYRTSGWYCHIILWGSFTMWFLSVILFRSIILYGAYCLFISGSLQLISNLIWFILKNPIPLIIPFENGNIILKFGITYWIVFISGITCILTSTIIIIFHHYFDWKLYNFFGVDPLNVYNEVTYLCKEENVKMRNKNENDVELKDIQHSDDNEIAEYVPIYIKRNEKLIFAKLKSNIIEKYKQ